MGKLKHEPIKGNQYGQWTVISNEIKRHSEKNNRVAYFNVRCSCGREGWRAAHTLINGTTKACKSCCKTPNNINSFILSYYRKSKQRAKDSGFEFNITPEYMELLFEQQEHKCKLSGLPIHFSPQYKSDTTASLDRIDNTLGYIEGNIQWLHKDINMMKHIHDQNQFIYLCKQIALNN